MQPERCSWSSHLKWLRVFFCILDTKRTHFSGFFWNKGITSFSALALLLLQNGNFMHALVFTSIGENCTNVIISTFFSLVFRMNWVRLVEFTIFHVLCVFKFKFSTFVCVSTFEHMYVYLPTPLVYGMFAKASLLLVCRENWSQLFLFLFIIMVLNLSFNHGLLFCSQGDIIMSLQSRLDVICDEVDEDLAPTASGGEEASNEKPVSKLILHSLRCFSCNIYVLLFVLYEYIYICLMVQI